MDLRDAFHWGTKQVFCYITAHYKTGQVRAAYTPLCDTLYVGFVISVEV